MPCQLLALLTLLTAPAGAATFQVADAMVKDQVVAGASIQIESAPGEVVATGVTDAQGRWTVDLEPGTWLVSYAADGYVPIGRSPTALDASDQVVTTALTMMLEALGTPGVRRVQVVLTWGSDLDQVPDADSHLVCACPEGAEVYFGDREHAGDGHSVDLDVDDVDWGGPETITLVDPPPGAYTYFVRNFSGPPHRLGSSDVVVRVLFGDELAREYRVPESMDDEDWFPFRALQVGEDLAPRLVDWTPEELAAGADRRTGPLYHLSCTWVALLCVGLSVLGVLALVVFRVARRRS